MQHDMLQLSQELTACWHMLRVCSLLTGNRDMLGTVSDYSLWEGHSSVAIIRSTARQLPPGSKLYMFATDGSRAAAVAYCMLCHQLVQPGDRLLLVSCSYDHSSPGNVSAASMEYNTNFKEYREMADALKVGQDWCWFSYAC